MNTYFIIEGDTSVINAIINVLEDLPEFNCIGYGHDYTKCMDLILKEMPDLIFLNIDTIGGNAFEFVKETKQYLKKDSEFIAISGSKEKTYDAIKTGFFDYLLNPMSDLEIRKAVLNFKKKHPINLNKTICLKSYKDYQYLNTDEILFLRADNNTTDFHMNDGGVISAFKTLKTFESILPDNFLRIHKSYIINSNYVTRVNYGSSKCTIKKCSHNVPFTKTYKNNVEFMVNSLSPVAASITLN
ncbi:MAG TPA: LytTR family DNA-binding domain-containing protein [Mariniflexile sp.]